MRPRTGVDPHEVFVDPTRVRGLTLPAMDGFLGRGRVDVELDHESLAAART